MPRVVFIGGGSSLSNGSAAANQFHAYLDLNWTLVQLTFTAGRWWEAFLRKSMENLTTFLK